MNTKLKFHKYTPQPASYNYYNIISREYFLRKRTITEIYSTEGEHLFAEYPSFLVFRHNGNRKWFAVIMDISRRNLKLPGEGQTQVVNLKCYTRVIGSFREESGIFPGWHMNKAHWIGVALAGTVDGEKIQFLVDMSYELTVK